MVTVGIVVLGLGFFTILGSNAMQMASALDQSHMMWSTVRGLDKLKSLTNSVGFDSGDYLMFHYSPSQGPTQTQINAMKSITSIPNSHKGFEFWSLANIKKYAPVAKQAGFGLIGYDLENGNSPSSEVSNPVNAFKQAQQIVHSYGLKLISIAGYPILTQYGTQYAKYVDGVHMQSQRLQNDDTTCAKLKNYVASWVSKLESANPNLAGHIIYQLSFSAGAASGKTIYQTLKDCTDATSPTSVDGLFIFWNSPSFDNGQYGDLLKYHESKYS
jgi:hypothetical protein